MSAMKKCLSHSYLYQKQSMTAEEEIISLNVGGKRFSTSRQTLTSIGDTFFTALLSGRIPSLRDSSGAIFVDRDPKLFAIILHYLRTRQLFDMKDDQNLELDPKLFAIILHYLRTRQLFDMKDDQNLELLLHESQFYGITPLVRRLQLCEQLHRKPTCGGDLLFQAHIRARNSSEPVRQVVAHHNAIAVAHNHTVTCYRLKDTMGWQSVFESQPIDSVISEIAFYYNCGVAPLTGPKLMLAIKDQKSIIRLWSITVSHYNNINTNSNNNNTNGNSGNESTGSNNNGFNVNSQQKQEIGRFHLNNLALGNERGRVGVWHSSSQHWLVQDLKQGSTDVSAITAYDKAGCNFLLLGSGLGSIYLIDMQKFPLRMKDGDLLINELYEDPEKEQITAISCYLTRTPKTNGNWVEIAYGTKGGTVRVLVQHPETVGHGPQLFQTFKVHLNGIERIMLSEKYLISVCNKMHVRTWTMTRFRGRISTQPGSTPHASFRIIKFDENLFDDDEDEAQSSAPTSSTGGNAASGSGIVVSNCEVGPFGDQDDGEKQVFIERFRTQTDSANVLTASNGQKICTLRSVDNSMITAYCVHECEAVAMGNRSRRYILT
ncbi:unnamed protein product, partial [Medioppia subpectinata]